jgi:Tfp pilus assembly protein PilX
MKINITANRRKRLEGAALFISLIITFVLGVGLASYLMLVQTEKMSAVRSQSWNAGLTAAEAAVEEAMAQLNPSAILFTNGNANIDRGANGWTFSNGLYRSPLRSMANGQYAAAITADAMPTIYATGYVQLPTMTNSIIRTIKVNTKMAGLFRGAMAARVNVDFKGFNVSTDSFDSNDPNHSTNGLYDAAKRKANGDVASTAGFINVQNAKVMGTLFTAPNGSYEVGANGSVGDVAWVSGGNTGLQDGHYKNDFNVDFPEVLPPYTTGLNPAPKIVLGTNYTWVLGSADYYYDDPKGASFKSGDVILVTSPGARLYVTGDFTMQGSSQIQIAPGASLEIFVGGANASITSVNSPGNCAAFKYFGLRSNTSVSISGNDNFLGSIYAPSAEFSLGGGGKDPIDFQGACAVSTIKMNGHFNFHFDENLIKKGPLSGYMIASWNEI